MARYIDADAMLSKVKVNDDLVGKIDGKTLKAWIDSQPTVDVAPVIHAHWLKINNPNYSPFDQSSEYYLFCSNCECGHVQMYNFCPSCGAKMDEEVENG